MGGSGIDNGAALIEEFFTTNEADISIDSSANNSLIPDFCVDGESVFMFELSTTINEVTNNDGVRDTLVMLKIDNVLVAQADVKD